jgi:hypothetical protein
MAFYVPRIPLISLIVVLVLGAALLGASAASAASCKPGQIQWIVKGKATCLKTASFSPTKSSSAKAADWVKSITSGKTPGERLVPKLALPPKLRRATPALARSAGTLATKAAAADPKAFKPKRKSRLAVSAASGPVAVATLEIPGPSKTTDGVELSSTAHLTRFEDGTVEAQLVLEAKANGYTVRYKPMIDMNGGGIPEVNCPTAAGKLTINDSDIFGGTVMVLKGNTVIRSRTLRESSTMRAEGQVGRDARLASVTAKVTSKTELYERGLQLVVNSSGNFSIQREGEVTPVGAPAIDVKIKAAGATAAEEAAAGKVAAAQMTAGDGAKKFGHSLDLARWRMMQDEYKWYQLPNYCASVSFDPGSVAKVQEGQSKSVKGVVTAKDGGESAGSFAVNSVALGAFSAVKPAVDPGSPALFSATGAKPAADKSTVEAEVIATSMAGRALGTWYAEGDDVKVPSSFGGWIQATTSGSGLKYEFDAYVNFNLTSVNTGPNGFATAWYEFSHFTEVRTSTNEIGTGCRWVAKGNAAQINSGDVELRRASTNAGWTYAIHLDFSIPNQTFASTDCPPGAELPSFTGDIVNYIYTKEPGAEFRPIWSGSTETDMRLIEMSPVSDVVGAASLPTTANWGLIGSFD